MKQTLIIALLILSMSSMVQKQGDTLNLLTGKDWHDLLPTPDGGTELSRWRYQFTDS